MSGLVLMDRLRSEGVKMQGIHLGMRLCDEAADRIEELEAALREIEQKLTTLNARWASEGGPFDGEWVSEVMALAPEQDR